MQVPREVLEAGAAPMTHHNAPEFQAVFKPMLDGLRPIFGNDGPILMQNSSGRGAMEASLTNLFSPGDAVAMLVNGRFGLRFAGIARDLGLVVHPVGPAWEYAVSEKAIDETLTQHPEIKGLIGSMCETGTGVMNDLDAIGRAGKRFNVITVVDAVSAAAGMPVRMMERNIDVCFSGIQKCFMSPPGLALVATGNRVWDAIRGSRHYRHYFNWVKMRDWLELPKARMMGTPPESLIRSLARAVAMMHDEGLPNVYARHAQLAEGFHAFVHAAGCELVAREPQYRSHTVSAMLLPAGIKAGDVVQRVLKNDNIRIASGQDSLKDTAIRVGHMGPVRPAMLLRGIQALARAMSGLGMDAKLAQAGVDASARVLARNQ
ncbi:MAG: alanine--glyoxylate aminotransferase family protein [Burkholderiales bacterium]